MNIRQLSYFCSAAETGSFSRAASNAGVSVQAVSKAIGELEEELGGPLFVRGSTGSQLTTLGRALMPYAAKSLVSFQRVEHFAKGATEQPASRIDDDTMVVIEQSPVELRELVETTGPTASVLSNIQIGQDGCVFALSAQTYVIEYHPDEALVGVDALDAGIDVAALEDGYTGWIDLDGQQLFCHVSSIGDMYYIAAVPAADMNAAGSVTVGVILFAFFVVVSAVALYGIFVLRQEERDGGGDAEASVGARGLRVNHRIAPKAAVLSVVGFLGILGVSFYIQTLFALSSQSLTLTERVEQVASTIERSQKRAEDLEDQYNERCLSKAKVAAYILVMRNSSISNVVNMTKETSYAAVEVGIEYGESLERVENILAHELPNIKRRLPAIIDGPFYKGVTMLADNSVNIKIVAECAEKDRSGLTNDLNREMKPMFDKYDISIPYPQIVINQPTVFKKATAAERAAADAFNASQKEAIKNLTDENEDFDEFNDTNRR